MDLVPELKTAVRKHKIPVRLKDSQRRGGGMGRLTMPPDRKFCWLTFLSAKPTCVVQIHALARFRGVEQRSARRRHKPKVVGSNPASAIKSNAAYTCVRGHPHRETIYRCWRYQLPVRKTGGACLGGDKEYDQMRLCDRFSGCRARAVVSSGPKLQKGKSSVVLNWGRLYGGEAGTRLRSVATQTNWQCFGVV